jgi:CheY-like chemotaxis protein
VFISSTYQDLITHREAAARAIERLGQQGVRMEVFGARPTDATDASLDEVANSDAFVGIYAHRYGYVPRDGSASITEREFLYAQEQRKEIFGFVIDEEYPWPPKHIETEPGRTRLKDFLQRLRTTVVVDTFGTPEDLAFKVSTSLGRFLLYRKVKEGLERVPGSPSVTTEPGRSQVARRAARLQGVIQGANVLLVNDVPAEMSYVIELLNDVGIATHVSTSSEDAIAVLNGRKFNAVISDMRRGSVEDEGIRFLGMMREARVKVPVVFSVRRLDPTRGVPPFAFGITNRVDELLHLVFDALERTRG